MTFTSELPRHCNFENLQSGREHRNIGGDLSADWPLQLLPVAYFQRKMDFEGQVTPFGQNKEEKYISSLFTGVESNPFHCNLLPRFSSASKGNQVPDPKPHERHHEACAPPFPRMHTRLSSLTVTETLESHQDLQWNPHNPENASGEPAHKGPCNSLTSTRVLLHAISSYYH